MNFEKNSRATLVGHAQREGELRHGAPEECQAFERRAIAMLQLIVATSEYQFG